jgi:hypothetical protein
MLTVTRTLPAHRSGAVPRRHSLKRLMESSTALLLFIIATLIIVLALLILFHHNLNATKGYRLRTLEHARTELLQEEEYVNMEIAKSQSLQAIKNDPQVQAMKKPVKPKYVQGQGAVSKGVAERLMEAVN